MFNNVTEEGFKKFLNSPPYLVYDCCGFVEPIWHTYHDFSDPWLESIVAKCCVEADPPMFMIRSDYAVF